KTTGTGVHRFDFDGRYAYLSPTLEGYVGNIVMIMDLKEPARPTEVGRWWLPGQWTAGGEAATWAKTAHRCHHPLRLRHRLPPRPRGAAQPASTPATGRPVS